MVTFTVTTSPAFSLLLAEPVALVIATPVTVGATVSVVPLELFFGPDVEPPTAAPANTSAPTANNAPGKDSATAAPAAPAASADAALAFAISLTAGATETSGTNGSGTVACANKMGSISAAPTKESQSACAVSASP